MKKLIFSCFAFLLVFTSVASSIVLMELNADSDSINKVNSGKVYVTINVSYALYARDLVFANPKIESISYVEDNKSNGFVNVFGGIGKNFLIEPNKIYEITAKEEINLIIPKNE